MPQSNTASIATIFTRNSTTAAVLPTQITASYVNAGDPFPCIHLSRKWASACRLNVFRVLTCLVLCNPCMWAVLLTNTFGIALVPLELAPEMIC